MKLLKVQKSNKRKIFSSGEICDEKLKSLLSAFMEETSSSTEFPLSVYIEL